MVIKLKNLKLLSIFVKAFPTSKIFCNICKWRSTRDYSGFPYVTRILNCALWVLYGLPIVKPNCILVSTINGIGLGMQIIYTTIFFIFSKDKDRRMKNVVVIILISSFFATVALSSPLIFHTHSERYTIVGAMCILYNVLMCVSPLSIMVSAAFFFAFFIVKINFIFIQIEVIGEKSVKKYINPGLSFIMFANGLIWIAYGAIHFDINIVLANGLGAGLAASELLLYAIYYSSTEFTHDDQKDAIEMDKSEAGQKNREKLH
ncbi:hypothetical protein SUGI_1111250 [Cryptomeria japonica]|nr:hypothetical protein SUGI_1111250 [Cryptomeria japonica]